jgi:hypothetical protein
MSKTNKSARTVNATNTAETKATAKPVAILKESTKKSPVAWVLAFFEKHKDLPRGEAIAKAVKAGVAYYTARTQYQKAYTARKTTATA